MNWQKDHQDKERRNENETGVNNGIPYRGGPHDEPRRTRHENSDDTFDPRGPRKDSPRRRGGFGPGRRGGFGPESFGPGGPTSDDFGPADFRHGGFGMFGRGPRSRRARKGDVRNAIMSCLAAAETSEADSNSGPNSGLNGYGLIKAIMKRAGGNWRPSPGSVYPALTGLESEGLITADGEGRRTEFRLTEAGRSYVEKNRNDIDSLWEANDDAEENDDIEALRESAMKLMGAVRQIGMDGSEEQLVAAQSALDTARRDIYKLLAE